MENDTRFVVWCAQSNEGLRRDWQGKKIYVNAVINAVKKEKKTDKLVSVYRMYDAHKKKIGIGTPQIISNHKNEITGAHTNNDGP